MCIKSHIPWLFLVKYYEKMMTHYLIRFIFALFTLILILQGHHAHAETTIDTEKLKQEIMQELLQSEAFRQKITEVIRAYETQKVAQAQSEIPNQRRVITTEIQKKLRPVALERDQIYGKSDAIISIIEFSDFECPYCRKVHPILRRLVDESQGQINWVFRHFPLATHKPNALHEAEVAECAGHLGNVAGFWKFTDALFQQPHRGKQDRQAMIEKAAQAAALNPEQLAACLKRVAIKDKVNADEAEALSLGLQGTPANILLNHKTGQVQLRQGAATLETFKADIQQLLQAQ